jgi:hypothetical protein
VTQRGLLDTEAASFIRIAEVRNNPLARSALSADGFDKRPVDMTRFVFLDRDLAQEHVANIQLRTGRTQ